ncbi:MAG: GGDEF domain-containing protein [Acidobacteriota bacterium]
MTPAPRSMGRQRAGQRLLRRLWRPPDPDLADAGQRGEWMIAGVRVLLVLLILFEPLRWALQSPLEQNRRLVVFGAVAALAEALVIYAAAQRSWLRGWIGFFSGLLDVSLVTLALMMFLRLGLPLEAINDSVIFSVYLLAIAATSLRYDWRISLLVGVVAMVQYGALVQYVVWQWDLMRPEVQPLALQFDWITQIGRLLLLAMATGLATALIVRAEEQRRLSNRDRLTNLANRGFFDESMARLGALASRSGEPVTVAMIDVDHFKRFNDTHGHQAGDEALRAVSRLMSKSFRTTDLVARYGGEEFAGLFPGMNLEDSARRLEQLRRTIEKMPIQIAPGRTTTVTVSIGVGIWPHDGNDLSEVLSLADERLYEAKNGGRNRVNAGGVLLGASAARPAPAAPASAG